MSRAVAKIIGIYNDNDSLLIIWVVAENARGMAILSIQ